MMTMPDSAPSSVHDPAGAGSDRPAWLDSERYRATGLADAVYVTGVVDPIPGHIKRRNDDFLVEELPLVQPTGSGDYIWAFVQKEGLSTTQLVDVLAKHFRVRTRDIGFAGMKDKRAVTRQVLSIHAPGRDPESFPMLDHHQVAILWVDLSDDRLRRGQLAGNGFSVRARSCDPMRVQDAHRILTHLSARGVPNYYGAQRFGARLNNHIAGRLMIAKRWAEMLDEVLAPDPLFPDLNTEARAAYAAGDYKAAAPGFMRGQMAERSIADALAKGRSPADAINAASDVQVRFWIAAWQSSVFNRVLARRVRDGTFDRILTGDVVIDHETGKWFIASEEFASDPVTQERVKRFELSPTGPLPGARTLAASGQPGVIEDEAFARDGLEPEDLKWVAKKFGDSVAGTRRPLRVRVQNPDTEGGVDEHGPFIRCKFELPAGSFATMVMREVMKVDPLDYVPKGERDRRREFEKNRRPQEREGRDG